MNRRGLILGASVLACARAQAGPRIHARPRKSDGTPYAQGTHSLGIRTERDTLLYVPATVADPAPLLVYLHGATGNAPQGLKRLSGLADEFGFLLLSPASTSDTWDAIRSGYDADVRMIDQALANVFERRQVDSRRIGVCGFSDGASYALGLGLSNGDLFRKIMAFSPGFIPSGVQEQGKPSMFVSHGTADRILPIDRCSRRLVPELKRAGYTVRYDEFEGPHTVPPEIARGAIEWFLR
jgi:predicted esterase